MTWLCWSNSALGLGLAVSAFLWLEAPARGVITAAASCFGSWHLYRALVSTTQKKPGIVLRLWGLEWTRDEACCHFLITGATGTGKTMRAIVPIIRSLRGYDAHTGILAVDSKGALWQPVERIAKSLGQETDLRLIRVRPPQIAPEKWTPPLRMNLLADVSIPWTTYAKILVDTATAAGQRGGQAFFKETARDMIAHTMRALELANMPVTLDNVHNAICVSSDQQAMITQLTTAGPPGAAAELQFFKDFQAQPPEQRSGTVFSIANILRPYTPKDIADVFCSNDENFSLTEVDAGRLICLSIPQIYQVERKYLNLLCKQLFFLHAFRRFDLPAEEMRRRNMIVLVLDEAQKTSLVSEDGFSDHTTVDELREAGVSVIAATQTPLSFYSSFENEKKADVFMANMRTQIHFRAADEKGAKILSEKLGGRPIKKRSGGVSGGKASSNWQLVDEPWVKSHEILRLGAAIAILRHPKQVGRPKELRLPIGSR